MSKHHARGLLSKNNRARWNRERKKLFDRYDWTCASCGYRVPKGYRKLPFSETNPYRLTIDHKIPIARGGSKTDIENWQPMCTSCNNHKADKLPTDTEDWWIW